MSNKVGNPSDSLTQMTCIKTRLKTYIKWCISYGRVHGCVSENASIIVHSAEKKKKEKPARSHVG